MNTTNKHNGFLSQIKIPVKDENGRVVFVDLSDVKMPVSDTAQGKDSDDQKIAVSSGNVNIRQGSQTKSPVKDDKKPVDMFEEGMNIDEVIEDSKSIKEEKVSKSKPAYTEKSESVLPLDRVQSDHWFDPEDEMELAKVKVPKVKKLDDDILKKEALTLAQKHIKGDNDKMINRLALIIFTYWKDLKDYLRTKDALMRKKELGGLSFSEDLANKVLNEATKKKKELLSGKSVNTEQSSAQGLEDIKNEQAIDKGVDIIEKDVPQNTQNKDKGSDDISSSQLFTEIKPRVNAKVASDIKTSGTTHHLHHERLVGPIKELELMDLETFRKLDKTPQDAAKRIKQKIDILGDESVEQMAKGITAFKNSPLYKMYLKIGSIGIEKHKPIKDVIEEKLAGDMTLEEFNAISDLSKSISF